MNFEFATASRIIFGEGKVKEIGRLANELGSQTLLVVDSNLKYFHDVGENLSKEGINYSIYYVNKEPTIQLIQDGLEEARSQNCNLVISLGGGSVIDTGKAIAGLMNNPGQVIDYLEVIGHGKKLKAPPIAFIAIPTTAGTGAEVTRNAVLAAPDHKVKVSLRSPLLLPRIAIVDPELTYGLPSQITTSTGIDAFTQLIEPYVSIFANPVTDAICREGLQRIARSLQRAILNGSDKSARLDMSLASLFGGLALANAKLGAVHGFAGPIGGMFPVPHGVICAALLPYVIAVNIRALQERQPDSPALTRYAQIASILTGDTFAKPEQTVDWIAELYKDINVPSFETFGIHSTDIPILIRQAQRASSMKGNPLQLSSSELEEILRLALTNQKDILE